MLGNMGPYILLPYYISRLTSKKCKGAIGMHTWLLGDTDAHTHAYTSQKRVMQESSCSLSPARIRNNNK